MPMRREGIVGPHHTNHTVRASRCGASFPEQYNCPLHSHDAVERAYHDLLDRTGKHRFSRLDLFQEAIKLFKGKGAYRTRMYECTAGRCFRKINRPCSCPQCLYLDTRKGKRRELMGDIAEEMREYRWDRE